MSDLSRYIVAALQLAGVIGAAVLMVSATVTLLVKLLQRASRKGLFGTYVPMVALRVLVGFRDTGPSSKKSSIIPVSSQNFIAMVGTAMGVWALIVVLSVMGGFEGDLKGKIVRHNPHITVEPRGSNSAELQDISSVERLEIWKGDISKCKGVHAVETYLTGEAMIASSISMGPGLTVNGIEPGGAMQNQWLDGITNPVFLKNLKKPFRVMTDRELDFSEKTIALQEQGTANQDEGAIPAIPDGSGNDGRVLPGILLGDELARSLSASIGEKVSVVVPDGDIGPTGVRPRTKSFRVVGTFNTGMYDLDLKTAFILMDSAKDLFLTEGPNRLSVIIDDLEDLDRIAAEVAVLTGAPEKARIGTVVQANRSLFTALVIEKIAMFLVLGLVILVAAFNTFGSLTLITLEKTRDISVLRSLGATSGGIRAIFLALGGVIGLVGTFSGLLLGLGTCAYIAWAGIELPAEYYLRSLPVEVRPLEVLAVVFAALGAGLLATIYPATAVATISPSQGLRND